MDKELFSFRKASKYAYSVAKVRFYETKLLSREKMLRMINAADVSECFRTLEEAGYPVSVGGIANFTPILQKEYLKALEMFKHLAKDDKIYALFAMKHDFHNLKVAAKEFFSKEEFSKAYQIGGLFAQSDIKSAVFDGNFEKLEEQGAPLGDAFAKIKESYEQTQSPRLIDIIADKALYEEIVKRAAKAKNSFVRRFFVKEIDLINIRTFFRLRYLQKKRVDFMEAFISGGDFHLDFFLKNYESDFYTLKNIFKRTEFLGLVTDGSVYLEERKSFLKFEKIINEYFMRYIKAAKWIPFGVEPVVAYYYAKDKEIKSVRTILTGKLNKLSADEIKEGIADEYI